MTHLTALALRPQNFLALVKKYMPITDLGHHISANLDDKSDILSRSRSLCGKINNLLCQFSNCDPFVKLRLLRNFCCDFYGCTLWDLAHSSINDLCIAWRKGLRRMWGLPYRAHSVLLAPLCDLLPLGYELLYRIGVFIWKCLDNDNKVVSNVTRNGIFFSTHEVSNRAQCAVLV